MNLVSSAADANILEMFVANSYKNEQKKCK